MRYDENSNLYKRWNNTTICCYKHNMICEKCPEKYITCNIKTDINNKYGMKPIRYAVLKTIVNI